MSFIVTAESQTPVARKAFIAMRMAKALTVKGDAIKTAGLQSIKSDIAAGVVVNRAAVAKQVLRRTK